MSRDVLKLIEENKQAGKASAEPRTASEDIAEQDVREMESGVDNPLLFTTMRLSFG